MKSDVPVPSRHPIRPVHVAFVVVAVTVAFASINLIVGMQVVNIGSNAPPAPRLPTTTKSASDTPRGNEGNKAPQGTPRRNLEMTEEVDEDEEALLHHQSVLPEETLETILSTHCTETNGAVAKNGIRQVCNPRKCRLCRGFVAGDDAQAGRDTDGDVAPLAAETKDYLRSHVLFSVITGNFDKFLRLELAHCTWLQHVPPENVFLMTNKREPLDEMNQAQFRGTWVEGGLPSGMTFSPSQLTAKGYTIDWIKAQYRFVEGLQLMANRSAEDSSIRWIAVVDDDTFVNLNALVTFFQRLDKSKGNVPVYVGDRGWGGAGHFFNAMAAGILRTKLHDYCTVPHMVKKSRASDEALKKCVPAMGIQVISDRLFSHCQANNLKKKLIRGDHISAHVKRDVTLPLSLAIFRMRLYYQVIYERNVTCAYHLLLHFGSCAYGSSCKISSCDTLHDRHALMDFNALVNVERQLRSQEPPPAMGMDVVGQNYSTQWWLVPRL